MSPVPIVLEVNIQISQTLHAYTSAAFQVRVIDLLTPTDTDIRLFRNVISTGSGQRVLRATPSWVQVGGHSSAQLGD
jgi:hypothetical protein